MDAIEIKINKEKSSFKYVDSLYCQEVHVQDIFYREIKPGDFVVLVFYYKENIWEDNTDLFLVSEKGLLIYNEKSNKFKQKSVCFMNISYQCTDLLVYKLEHSLTRYDLLKQDEIGEYYIEDSDDFCLSEVLSRHKEAVDIKAGDLVYTFSRDFIRKKTEDRYGICIGSSDYFINNYALNNLNIKNSIEIAYKVLNPTDKEKEVKRQLTVEYSKWFENQVKFLAKDKLIPGDVFCDYTSVSIYLFDCIKYNKNKISHICLSLVYCDKSDKNRYENLAVSILAGKMTERAYKQLLDKYYVTIKPLCLNYLQSNYIGSNQTGITASVINKAIHRYKRFDRKYKHTTLAVYLNEQYRNPIEDKYYESSEEETVW